MMRTIAIAACLVLGSSLAFAQAARKPDCTKGDPWRLPAKEHAETPLKVDGTAGRMVHICNCSGDAGSAAPSVWIGTATAVPTASLRAMRESTKADVPNIPSNTVSAFELPAGSCADVGTATVTLLTADHTKEAWGSFELSPN